MLNNLLIPNDRARAIGIFTLEKFDAISRKSGRDIVAPTPHETLRFSNLLTTVGAQLNEDLLIGAGGTALNNANSYIGVGDSSTAAAVGQTDLQAVSNKLRVAMDATFPSRASTTLTWRSTFSTAQANWTWNEMAVFNAAAAGTMFCRALVSSPFTKTSALSIVASYTWAVS